MICPALNWQLLSRNSATRSQGNAGSHIRLTSDLTGTEHHITIPAHDPLKTGTLSGILNEVAAYLGITRNELLRQLFD